MSGHGHEQGHGGDHDHGKSISREFISGVLEDTERILFEELRRELGLGPNEKVTPEHIQAFAARLAEENTELEDVIEKTQKK